MAPAKFMTIRHPQSFTTGLWVSLVYACCFGSNRPWFESRQAHHDLCRRPCFSHTATSLQVKLIEPTVQGYGPPCRIMDEGTTNLWGWIVNIITVGGGITGILAIFAWVKEDAFNPVLFGISAVGGASLSSSYCLM